MRQRVFVVSALILWAGVTQLAAAQPSQPPAFSTDLTRSAVRRVVTAAADWQLAHPSEHAPYDWTVAAFYTGMMALTQVRDSPDSQKYYDAMKTMGERNQWRPGLRPGHADDYAVIATYAKIFQREKDRKILEPSLALFDFLTTLPFNEPLTWGNGIETREWAWCDALFMGPPALAAVTTVTGDRKYLDLANRLWWKTKWKEGVLESRQRLGVSRACPYAEGAAGRPPGARAVRHAFSGDGTDDLRSSGEGWLLASELARSGQPPKP